MEERVTAADQAQAVDLLADVHSGWCAGHPAWRATHPGSPCHCRLAGREAAIAQVLADERVRVLAPLLALADEYDANINWREWGIGNRIRQVIKDGVVHGTPADTARRMVSNQGRIEPA